MSIAEKLREAAAKKPVCGSVDRIALALANAPARCDGDCGECIEKWYGRLADAIEAELNASKPTPLPDGIIWPTFEDGTPVKFWDVFVNRDGEAEKVTDFHFFENSVSVNGVDFCSYGEPFKRPEPEVLDADGVPIKVGDTVWFTEYGAQRTVSSIDTSDALAEVWFTNGLYAHPSFLTHRKPDTQQAIDEDCWLDAKDYCEKHNVKTEWPKHYGKAKCEHLLARQRKLLGGE